jgi:7-carboxy-7-deazaguanine synthase
MQIAEIFQSIDGEVNLYGQGGLTTFVRTAGCNFLCEYCDTPQGHEEGTFYEVKDVFDAVKKLECPKVTLTGGDPLYQRDNTISLIDLLLRKGFHITVETNGSYAPSEEYLNLPNLGWVFDYKLQYADMMKIDMMECLGENNWIKIVIQSEADYMEALRVVERLRLAGSEARIAFSPCFPDSNFPVAKLVQRLLADRMWDIVVNVQIHKLISVK